MLRGWGLLVTKDIIVLLAVVVVGFASWGITKVDPHVIDPGLVIYSQAEASTGKTPNSKP